MPSPQTIAAFALTIMSGAFAAPAPLDPNTSASSLSSTNGGLPPEPGVVIPALFTALGGKPTPFGCQGNPGACYSSEGQTANGLPWTISSSNGGSYLFLQNDADVVNCLVNLHFTQNTRCISVKGSECEAKVTTSKVQDTRSINPTAGAIGALKGTAQVTAPQSLAIQSAVQAMVGQNVTSSYADAGGHGGDLGAASGKAGSEDAYISIDFSGQDDC